ncbi:hypothetical protein [Flavobacterium sp.]|uniref:hypothetical protein n=1 Tax=Flavobacterium sp. TaxID=239 RepID=UPI002635E732|nr:hypothetical protein [Flavobacterium sp.]
MGTSIGTVLLVFKVYNRHSDVIKQLEKKGYMDRWGEMSNNKVHVLPGNTLWHNFKSTDAALLDLKNVCTTLNILIENAIAVNASDFTGI